MIRVILLFYIAAMIVATGQHVLVYDEFYKQRKDFFGCFKPKYLYNESNLNMFGCILGVLAHGIFMPILAIIYILYLIVHVGRKNP